MLAWPMSIVHLGERPRPTADMDIFFSVTFRHDRHIWCVIELIREREFLIRFGDVMPDINVT